MSLHLYHHNSSVCAAKVRIALAEKGLAWDGTLMTLQGDQFDPAYLRLNPNAVVPTLVHDGRAIIESNVILEYLDDAFPTPPLRPAEPADRADMRLLFQRLDDPETGIHRAVSVITFGAAYRHFLIDEAGGTDPALLRPVIERQMNPKSCAWLEDVVLLGAESRAFRQAIACTDALLDDFERRLGTSDWLTGDCHSLSDIAFTPYLARLDLLGFDALFVDRPRLGDWYGRLCIRGSAREVFDRYRPEYRQMLEERGRDAAMHLPGLLSGLRNRGVPADGAAAAGGHR